jgi:hypothetical protein
MGLEKDWVWRSISGIAALTRNGPEVRLDPDQMPEFVSFRNITDPRTIVRVDPFHPVAWLGDDVKLERVVLRATTDTPMLGRLTQVLRWLDPSKDFLDGSRWGDTVGQFQSRQFSQCIHF